MLLPNLLPKPITPNALTLLRPALDIPRIAPLRRRAGDMRRRAAAGREALFDVFDAGGLEDAGDGIEAGVL